jgi:murein DD-endopeptidase MepM/ murein hydrolase activator NlpD
MSPRTSKRVTVMIHTDDASASRSFRLPVWVFRAAVGGAIVVGLGLLAGVAFYVPLLRAAASVPLLRGRVAELEAENARVEQLAVALDSAEARYGRVREMMGLPDSLRRAGGAPEAAPLLTAPAVRVPAPGGAAAVPAGLSAPARWPLDEPGYQTRGATSAGGTEEAHAGIDIAVPVGQVVRAAGGGVVLNASPDPVNGLHVLLQHPDDLRTMYGHLSRLTVAVGDTVPAGGVLGLSGNTGRSTAPHLHFEVRRGDRPLDPLTFVREDRH